jgi:hypothetical protein
MRFSSTAGQPVVLNEPVDRGLPMVLNEPTGRGAPKAAWNSEPAEVTSIPPARQALTKQQSPYYDTEASGFVSHRCTL